MAAGPHIPMDDENPYWRDIPLPGGVKHEDWNGFHDLILIEALHSPDFGAVMGLFGGNYDLFLQSPQTFRASYS